MTAKAGLDGQLGGLNCVQADFNNDGHLDIFIPRGAWLKIPMRPSLLRNNGDGTFTDVTAEAGLLMPANSITAQWADYDNDGHLDLFVCNERPARAASTTTSATARSRKYAREGRHQHQRPAHEGRRGWIDFDGDRFPDLFLNILSGTAELYRNNGNGTFTDVTTAMGIDGPKAGFSCWAFDYDNDGRPDSFATCYDNSLKDVVAGMNGLPHSKAVEPPVPQLRRQGIPGRDEGGGRRSSCSPRWAAQLRRLRQRRVLGLLPRHREPGLFDARPEPDDAEPGWEAVRRYHRAVRDEGHLQEGRHGVACGDWTRTGVVDIVIEMGGAVDGDRYHNVLFKNPGNDNNWLTVKLVGKKTNRSAIGARVKVVTAGPNPRTIYRWVTSGSSFGANPLEQHIGLGKADKVAELEIFWPTSNTTSRCSRMSR